MVGGLLSAHLLSKKAGVELEAGWPCSGPLLRMAEEAARKLLPGENSSGSCRGAIAQRLTGVSEDPTLLTGVVPVWLRCLSGCSCCSGQVGDLQDVPRAACSLGCPLHPSQDLTLLLVSPFAVPVVAPVPLLG